MLNRTRYKIVWPFSDISVHLGATAGLRLLNLTSPDLVQNILDECYKTINNFTNWSISEENGAQVLSGDEEALFGWISVNLIEGKMGPKFF